MDTFYHLSKKHCSAADIFLMTSKTEGLGTTLLDAMAANVPIVATEAGGIPEIIKHNQTGLIAPVKDAAKLAENVLLLIENTELKNKLVENAFQFVKQFSKESMANKTMEIYHRIVQN